MAYRPQYKNASGAVVDLPLDAETVQGHDVVAELSGKASSSHNHSAANITSGTLAVARGGTGVTSYSSLASQIKGYIISEITASGSLSRTVADMTEYRFTNVSSLSLSYPSGNFECWIRITVRTSGTATVSFPSGTTYIGNVPTSFEAGKTYEISIKDKIAIIAEVS